MPSWYALEAESADGSLHPPKLEQAGLTINHALLVGELLGVDVRDVGELLQDVARAERLLRESFPGVDATARRIDAERLPVVVDMSRRVHAALDAAIDAGGRPRGAGGERLRASPLLAAESDGVLYVKRGRLPLPRLLDRLEDLERFLLDVIDERRDVVMT